MAIPVILPRQGQSVERCIFTEWHAEIGDTIKKGDLLFSYETDKAAFEGEAPADGILLAVFAEPGEEIPVLQNIAVIGEKGESFDEFKPGAGDVAQSVEGSSPEEKHGTTPEKEIIKEERYESGTKKISPRARKRAHQLNIRYDRLEGSGPYGRIIEKDILHEAEKIPKATPLARSILSKDQLTMPSSGSGADGKITVADLKKTSGTDDYKEIKVSNIRKIIAENMHASLRNTAQLTLHTSADARRIKAARKRFKRRFEEEQGINITINDMVCYAVVKAIMKNTALNAHFLGESIRYYKNVHLGIAVDTERGLIVPTVKNANHLKLEGLSSQMKEIAVRAQEGKIDPELLKGATFTVTNLGAYGIEMFTPVLNPPQIGILGVNNITMYPASMEDGSFGFVPRIGLSLTFDHRGIDGAPAASFLKELSYQIESFEIE